MTALRICRFTTDGSTPRVGLSAGDSEIVDLTTAGIATLAQVLEDPAPHALLQDLGRQGLRRVPIASATLLAPVERQEVWAAGVTYLRSKAARMEESDFSAGAYDRVYEAERPELFFKSLGEKVVSPGDAVGIRGDARWSVPEPELALVLNARGVLVGYTIGNDVSSRDIEGENLLYLPQAKVYDRSCALGPWICTGVTEHDVRQWPIGLSIRRHDAVVFEGRTTIGNIKRSFDELAAFLCRCQHFPHGAVLLTGTGIVPPDEFTLEEGDLVEIDVPAIGVLRSPVVVV